MIAVRVASALGKRLRTVDRWPWAEVLYVFLHLTAQDRREALTRDVEQFTAARRAAVAFHGPEELEAERRDLLARWRGAPAAPDPALVDRLVTADAAGTWRAPEADAESD